MTDILSEEKINALGPIVVEMNGSKYDLEFVCVQTGCSRINVCGLGQNCHWDYFDKILDWDNNEYDPISFYINQESRYE